MTLLDDVNHLRNKVQCFAPHLMPMFDRILEDLQTMPPCHCGDCTYFRHQMSPLADGRRMCFIEPVPVARDHEDRACRYGRVKP